jgi:metal-responsive CopG/Arc/MetJ family transcriptional regulator
MSQVKTGISIQETLLTKADAIAHELELNRSQFLALALEDYIKRYNNKKIFDQINEAYSPPDQEDKAIAKVMRSQQRKLARSEPCQ